MITIFDFGGQSIVSSHIQTFWTEAADTICVQLTSGAVAKEVHHIEDVPVVMRNIRESIIDNPHI